MFVTTEPRHAWLDGLNDAQRRAVEHRSGHLMIVAGAGTGKTRTLAARVAALIEEGQDPDRILLLTFTRRAAAEMIDRVASLTDRRAATRVWGGTFHAIANRLLRVHAQQVGLSASFTVLDQADATELVGLVRARVLDGEKVRRMPRADTIAAIASRVVNTQSRLADVVAEHYPWCGEHVELVRDVIRGFVAAKRGQNVLDYDDLLLHWRALSVSPEVGERLCARFDHVLVDEYQDTNLAQADIVRAYGARASVTVVGDDAQAIYGFRAATAENLRGFPSMVDGAEVVTLEQNYRSTNPILAAANAVLAQSAHHLDKTLWSERSGGARPRIVTCADEGDQSDWVCRRVLELREEGVGLAEQAVLVRTGHHSDHLELELARRDIPFVKFGGLKFLEAAHVKDVMALLRVLDNPADQLAWSRVLSSLEGVGPATVRRVTSELGLDGDDAAAGFRRFVTGEPALPASARDDAEELRAAWRDCVATGPTGDADALAPAAQLDRLRAFCTSTFTRRYRDSAARLADLDQLAVTAAGYESRSRFLTELVLDPPERTGDYAGQPHLDDEYLTLSTIHSAKGGEWRSVILLHAADGNIPSDMALGDDDGLEEERRLAYVALTRAKDHLAVTFPLRYHVNRYGSDDRHHLAPLSRFIEPIRDLFDESGAGVSPAPDSEALLASVNLTDEVDAYVEGLLD